MVSFFNRTCDDLYQVAHSSTPANAAAFIFSTVYIIILYLKTRLMQHANSNRVDTSSSLFFFLLLSLRSLLYRVTIVTEHGEAEPHIRDSWRLLWGESGCRRGGGLEVLELGPKVTFK